MAADTAIVSPCLFCPKPGACCDNFMLQRGQLVFWKASWQADSREWLDAHGLPFFVPRRIDQEYAATEDNQPYVSLLYGCNRLGKDGRCTDYANRPQVCRDYKAGQDALCVLFVPLTVEGAAHV